jgi:hypothetical protein
MGKPSARPGRVGRRLSEQEAHSEAVWRGLLGSRVSIRYRLHEDPAHPHSEAVGVVQSVELDASGVARLRIVNRRGELRDVPVQDVLAAKIL